MVWNPVGHGKDFGFTLSEKGRQRVLRGGVTPSHSCLIRTTLPIVLRMLGQRQSRELGRKAISVT